MTNWYKVRIILFWWSCTPTSRTSLQGCTYNLCDYFRKFLYSNIRGVGVEIVEIKGGSRNFPDRF